MAFPYINSKGQKYYLHRREMTLVQGQKQTIYFFAKDIRSDAIDAIPTGYEVIESRNGLPILKKLR